jgi:hypothetical protein
VADAVPSNSPAEPASLEVPVIEGPRKKTSRKKASTPPSRRPSKAPARATSAEVKVGTHTIVMPESLATRLKPKDLKKLRAIFKRVSKRGKKRAAKTRAVKKR